MFKYIVSWGLFIHGIVNWGFPENIGKPGFQKIGEDSAIFYNRDSAEMFVKVLTRDYLKPPNNKQGRVFQIKIDSTFEPQAARKKRFLFF